MFPGIVICRHLQVEWLDSAHCCCQGCGKVGHWSNGMVIWQRRPKAPIGGDDREPDAETISLTDAESACTRQSLANLAG